MTKGEARVGVAFNPSGNPVVAEIKDRAAGLIDLIESIEPPDGAGGDGTAEVGRLKALAQTEVEAGAMWAVKAATKGR